jgi:hypothetical protein
VQFPVLGLGLNLGTFTYSHLDLLRIPILLLSAYISDSVIPLEYFLVQHERKGLQATKRDLGAVQGKVITKLRGLDTKQFSVVGSGPNSDPIPSRFRQVHNVSEI